MSEPRSLWEDLQQRRVVRAVIIYAIVGWGAFEVTETVAPYLDAPEWIPRVALFLLLLGFPLVAGLAWAFDVDRSGVQRAEGSSSRARIWVAVAGAGVLALGIGAFTLRTALGPDAGAELDPMTVAVSPFRASVGPELQYLGEGMVDLLAVRFSEEDGLQAVDPSSMFAALSGRSEPPGREELARIARRLGAGRVLSGGLVGDARQITITAELNEVGSGRTATQEVTGSLDSLPALVDRLVSRLLSLEAGEREERIGYLAGSPPEAVRDYLKGRTLYRNGAYEAAVEAFTSAIRADSTFALAGIALANAAGMTLTAPIEAAVLGRRTAWEHRDRLPPADREFLRFFLGENYPLPRSQREAVRDGRLATARFPDRIEAWYLQADPVFHFGALLGIDDYLNVSLQGFRRLLELDSTHVVALQHQIWPALILGEDAVADSAARRILRHSTELSARWEAAKVLGLDSLGTFGDGELSAVESTALVGLMGYAGLPMRPSRVEPNHTQADQIVDILRGRPDGDAVAPVVFSTQYNRGHLDDAVYWLERARRTPDPSVDADHLLVLASLFGDLGRSRALPAVGRLAVRAPGELAGGRAMSACLVGVWSVQEGEVDEARRMADRLSALDPATPQEGHATEACGLLIEAQVSVAEGESDGPARVEALERWSMDVQPVLPQFHSALPVALGRLYRELGDLEAAQNTLARCCGFAPGYFVFTTDARLDLADVALARGDTATARHNLELYLAARSTADAELREEVDRVRTLLRELGSGN